MGYYTSYTLEMEGPSLPSEKAVCEALDKINPYLVDEAEDFDHLFNEELKWYEHDEDMLKLSKQFPDVIFALTGYGEERDDNWVTYYKNGISQFCSSEIVFEPFNPELFYDDDDGGDNDTPLDNFVMRG